MKRTKRRNGRQVPQLHERRERAPDVATDDWVPKFVWDADAELRMNLMERWTTRNLLAGERVPWRRAQEPRPAIYVPKPGVTIPPVQILGPDGQPLGAR